MKLAHAEFLERLARYGQAAQEIRALLKECAHDPGLTARAHLRAAWVHYWTGQPAQARAHIDVTLELTQAHDIPAMHADALYVAGLIEQSAADTARARAYYERALALYRQQQNRFGESSALVNLADIAVDETMLDDALRYGEQALALSTRTGKRFDQAAANVILGSLMFVLGEAQRAAPFLVQALHIFRDVGNSTGESIALCDYARLLLQHGAAYEALNLAAQAARIAQEIGSSYREGMARTVMGDAYFAQHELQSAAQAYAQAVEQLKRAERGHLALDALAGLVRVALARNDASAAFTLTNEILARFDAQTFYDSHDPVAVCLVCIQVLSAQHDPRAQIILARAYTALQRRAERVRDDALRQMFLDQPASHRALCALHKEAGQSEPNAASNF